MKLILLLFTTLFYILPCFSDDLPPEEFVYIVQKKENKQSKKDDDGDDSKTLHNKKIRDFIKDQSRQLIDKKLDASGNVISTGYIGLGMKLNIQKISPEDIFQDTDKFSNSASLKDKKGYNQNWYKYMISVSPIFGPADILNLFDDIKLPLKLTQTLGLRVGSDRRYEVVLPQGLEGFRDESTMKQLWNHLKDSSRIYRMAFPTRAKHFLNAAKYPSGSEFNWKKSNFALFTFGVVLPTNYVQVSARTYFMAEGNLYKQMKVYRISGKTFVQVELGHENEKSNEQALEGSLGFSLFEAKKVKLNTSIRVISASRTHVSNNSFKITYVFDLSYPKAQEALDEIMKNNFIKAQQYAVDTTNPMQMTDNYEGVLLLENHTQEFLSKIYALNAGIFQQRLNGRVDKFSFSLNQFIPDIYHFSNSKSETISKGEYNYPYSMPINRVSLTLKKEKNNKILNGIWANKNKSIIYNNEHITYQSLSHELFKVNQITIQERLSNKNNSPKTFKKFYEPNRYIFQLLKPTLSALLNNYEQQKECYKNYVMNKHLILQNDAITKILAMTEKQYYQVFAILLNVTDEKWWYDPKLREVLLKNFQKTFKEDDSTTSSLKSYSKKIFTLYRKMEKDHVIAKIESYKKQTLDDLIKIDKQLNKVDYSKFEPNNFKEAIIFHLIFRDYIMQSGFIDYLTILAKITAPQDFFHGFTLKSDQCNIQWIGSEQSKTDPESISKEIEEFDLNFWDE